MLYMKTIFLIPVLILLSCSPKEQKNDVDDTNFKRYEIVATSNGGKISNFFFKDDSDTLKICYAMVFAYSSLLGDYNLVIDDETKAKIKDVFLYHSDIDSIKASEKSSYETGTVTFEIASSVELIAPHFSNKMVIEFKNISKNSDVSNKYKELIVYLKKKYKEFDQWPD